MGLIYIVARDLQNLYEQLRRDSVGEPDVQVILDRRVGERRQRPGTHSPEWRQAGRRQPRPSVEANLQSLGWAVVRTR